MRKFYLFCLILIFCVGMVNGQQQPDVREKVFLHLNNTSLITGETLYFSASVVSAQTNKFSAMSKILYVELVNSEGTPIYQAKVQLKKGKGYGDIFMTSLISTGSYHLYAYTRWMKNFGDYFHESIQVINPFEEYELPAETDELKVSFYPEGGIILKDVENLLVIRVEDFKGNGVALKARIVDQDGDNVAEFSSTTRGIGRLLFTPKANSQYQLIVEDQEGNFQFAKLPPIQDTGNVLSVRERGNTYLLTLTGSSDAGSLIFQAQHGQQLLVEQEIVPNTNFALSRVRLKEGVCRLVVRDAEKIVSERLIYVRPENGITTETDIRHYGTRSLIKYPISLGEDGIFSISVKKTYQEIPNRMQSTISELLLAGVNEKYLFTPRLLFGEESEQVDNLMLMCNYAWNELPNLGTVRYLPDHRGEIISGQMELPDSIPEGDKFVSFSIIGDDYQVRTAQVRKDGNFSMVVNPFEGERTAYISSLEGFSGEQIQLDQPFLDVYPAKNAPLVTLDSVGMKELVERSIRNQIENAYFEFKRDSVVSLAPYPEEFGAFEYFYVLDDFNRFPTIRDSFVEYIPTVNARQRKDGDSFKVSPKYILQGDPFQPRAFLDGLPVSADEILDFSPYRIESIGIINNRYFLGPLIADGIISFRTKDGDLQGFTPGDYTREISYLGLSPKKIYTFPEYDESGLNARIPDFRDQLYWDPQVEVTAGEPYSLEFYSSDTKGEFEIAIEGFTKSGKRVSIRKYLVVE